jgi:sigma-B regulation protein RsbU (phosphoserine phosphatase)
LYLYSDGICELHKVDGSMWSFADFVDAMSAPLSVGESALERIYSIGKRIQGGNPFVDDFSILEVKIA